MNTDERTVATAYHQTLSLNVRGCCGDPPNGQSQRRDIDVWLGFDDHVWNRTQDAFFQLGIESIHDRHHHRQRQHT